MTARLKPWERIKQNLPNRVGIEQRKKYLIITEGATEKAYFPHFRTPTGPDVVVIDSSDNKLGLMRSAVKLMAGKVSNKELFLDIDEVWVILDRDVEPSNKSDKHNFNAALALANKHGIKVGYSNDAFELWYLLHYQEASTAMYRRDLDAKLTGHLGRTYKSRHESKVEDLFVDIWPQHKTAIRRANGLLKRFAGQSPESANPSTTVSGLVDQLVNEADIRINR